MNKSTAMKVLFSVLGMLTLCVYIFVSVQYGYLACFYTWLFSMVSFLSGWLHCNIERNYLTGRAESEISTINQQLEDIRERVFDLKYSNTKRRTTKPISNK